jgi:uncharacterized protein (DUF2164 family)
MYLLKAEKVCGSLDKDNWDRLIASLSNVVNAETDPEVKKQYADTLAEAYKRQEAAGFYNEGSDLFRGAIIMQTSNPDVKQADMYFQRGIKANGTATHESYIVYSYYATYTLYSGAEGDEKAALKKRIIKDYFTLTEIVSKAGMSGQTQETLTTYLNYVVESCEALLPEIPEYIKNLPADNELAIEGIKQMLGLLNTKGCNDTDEHLALVEAWLERDPNSIEALLAKLDHMPGSKAIPIIDEIMSKTDDAEMKAELLYKKAYLQFKASQYQAAHATGKACTGKYRADGLLIAAQSVAATAMSMGDSTFERKCNYLYAAQLAEQAGNGGQAATYRSKAPSSSECFNENSPQSVTLSWGVTVNPCP